MGSLPTDVLIRQYNAGIDEDMQTLCQWLDGSRSWPHSLLEKYEKIYAYAPEFIRYVVKREPYLLSTTVGQNASIKQPDMIRLKEEIEEIKRKIKEKAGI